MLVFRNICVFIKWMISRCFCYNPGNKPYIFIEIINIHTHNAKGGQRNQARF